VIERVQNTIKVKYSIALMKAFKYIPKFIVAEKI
jgi:hypothetical protein